MSEESNRPLGYFAFAGVVGVLLLLNWLGTFKTVFGLDTAILLTLIAGYKIFYNAIAGLLEREISADLAIAIAAIAGLAVGAYLAAAEAMFIMLIGEGLEAYAVSRTGAAIAKLAALLPRRGRVRRNSIELEVPPEEIRHDDIVVVRPGERIPMDGVVLTGESDIDESTLTGESVPAQKAAGDRVYGGTFNIGGDTVGLLEVAPTAPAEESAMARIVRLVKEARENKAPVERAADRYAKFFLPLILAAAAVTFVLTREWIRVAAVLIVACPCALVLATPAAMLSAIGRLARSGILLKGGVHLEAMARANAIVFDKTGTLTEGCLKLSSVHSVGKHLSDEVLETAAAAESGSEHLLARAVVEGAATRGFTPAPAEAFSALPGRGVLARVGGREVLVGNPQLFASREIPLPAQAEAALAGLEENGETPLVVAVEGEVIGVLGVRDELRPGAREAIRRLRELGIEKIVLLTGDRRRNAESLARQIGITEVQSQLLPEEKLEKLRQLQAAGYRVAMVGDGINDAPALAAANVGVALGRTSVDVAAEAADIVYLAHNLDKFPVLVEVSRKALGTVRQNIWLFALLTNLLAIAAAAYGILGPIGAAVFHQSSSFLVMMNSLRLLRERPWFESLPWQAFIVRCGAACGAAGRRAWSFWETLAGDATRYAWRERHGLWKPTLVGLVALWMASGVYVLNPQETAVVQRFGRKLLPYRGPGLHYALPSPIEKVSRIDAARVRVMEVGFRTISPQKQNEEPAAYEWNVAHRTGRYEQKLEEALMLTGDQNLVTTNAIVHYLIDRPDDYLFRLADPEATMRGVAEGAIRSAFVTGELDVALTTGRTALEARGREEMQRRLDRYGSGIRVLSVRLEDVHPPLEVVDAFREVSSAFEEKNRLVNEAEAYRNQQVALARGQAASRIEEARAYLVGRSNRATGDAARFLQAQAAYRAASGPTETRLFLETMEQVLPGRNKVILDTKGKGKRQLLTLDSQSLKLLLPNLEQQAQPAPRD